MAKWDQFDLNAEMDDTTPYVEAEVEFRRRPIKFPLFIAFAASIFGIVLASQSTSDFVAHLDRAVHAMHCSVVPGGEADIGESGCRTVMLSPYSSWFRDRYWGGIPIA
ncbi:MAG: hypothetical protein VX589_07300, partial [Myxococcota bacterium]|nr:hypothetical protein [Myxococcota bacterium]